MAIRIIRLGSPREKDEGLRIGTVRRPPATGRAQGRLRGERPLRCVVPEPRAQRGAAEDRDPAARRRVVADLQSPVRSGDEAVRAAPRRDLDLLAALSHHADFAIGCYCEDEARCHRSILRTLLEARGAEFSTLPPVR